MSGGGSVQDVVEKSRDEKRSVDTCDVQCRLRGETSKLVGRRGIPTSGEAEQLPDERHGVEVVLPDVEASRAQLGRDGLMVRVLLVLEVLGDGKCDVFEDAVGIISQKQSERARGQSIT